MTAADTGSQAVAIAKDLLHVAHVEILHGQDAAVADDLQRLLGLGPRAPQPGHRMGDGRYGVSVRAGRSLSLVAGDRGW
jgi:hypothetical protein